MPHSDEPFLRALANVSSFRNSEPAMCLIRALPRHPAAGVGWEALARLVFVKKGNEKGNIKERSAAFRSLLYRVKQWLDEAYADPASPLQQYPRAKIIVDARKYSLQFLSEGTRPHLSAFWRPYLVSDDKDCQIQTADRFFLRLGDHFYFRDIQSPDRPDLAHFLEPICHALGLPPGPFPEVALSRLREEALQALAAGVARFLSDAENWGPDPTTRKIEMEDVLQAIRSKFKPGVSRHYVSAGESVALTHIAELFQDFRKPVIFGNRAGIANDSEKSNIIQVGKPQGGPLAATLDSRRFRVLRDRVEDTKDITRTARLDHLRTHADEVADGAQPGRVKYSLITRCPHQARQIITSIVASHGRVTEAAAWYLTDEASLAEVFKDLKWNLNSVPPVFQFVLKAEVSYGKGSDRTVARITGVESGWYNID